MADPLSISASIAGLVTLADVVFLRLTKYIKSVKNAEKEVDDLRKEVNLLGGAVNMLSRLASGHELDDQPFNKDFRMHHIEGCAVILTDILQKTKKYDANPKGKLLRLMWPYTSSKTKDLLANLSRHKENINLALAANSMEALLRCLAKEEDRAKALAEIQADVQKTREIVVRIQEDSHRKEVLRLFLPYNPQPNYEMSIKLRHPMTGMWLERLPSFQTWLSSPSSRLWLSGIPGPGKTVLAGSIIGQALVRCSDTVATGFFFCDYKNKLTQTPESVLGALAHQIARQNEQAYLILEEYYSELHPEKGLPRSPDPNDLARIIVTMAQAFNQVYLVIDGLDECQDSTDEVVRALCTIAETSDEISMAVLSRHEDNIRDSLQGPETGFINIQIAAHKEDITEYVTSEIQQRMRDKRLHLEDPSLQGEILDGLVDGANGMFRWVACQLDHLGLCMSDEQCREALHSLPPDLPETYLRILKRVPNAQQSYVQLTLDIIAYADPKPNIAQLREILSVPSHGSSLKPGGLIREDAITRHCSSLIRKSNDGEFLEFAHFSVQEFLRSVVLQSSEFRTFSISKDRCNRLLATRCVEYLQLEDFNQPPISDARQLLSLEQANLDHPLYGYASHHWLCYARQQWDDPTLLAAAKRLFNPCKTTCFIQWAASLILHLGALSRPDEEEDEDQEIGLIEEILDESFHPLHLATTLCLPEISAYLLGQMKHHMGGVFISRTLKCAVDCLHGSLRLSDDDTRELTEDILVPFTNYIGTPDSRTQFALQTIRLLLQHFQTTPASLMSLAIDCRMPTRDFSVVQLLFEEGATLLQSDLDKFSQMASSPFAWKWECDQTKSLFRLCECLSHMIDKSPLHLELCRLVWSTCLILDTGKGDIRTYDIDSRITEDQAGLEKMAIWACEASSIRALREVIEDPRVDVSSILDVNTGNGLLHMLALADHSLLQDTGNPRWASELNEMFDLLLGCGCSLSLVNKDGHTPLSLSLEQQGPAFVNIFLSKAEFQFTDYTSPVPILLLVAKSGSEEILDNVLRLGLHSSSNDYKAKTPLHCLHKDANLALAIRLGELFPGARELRADGKMPWELYLDATDFDPLSSDVLEFLIQPLLCQDDLLEGSKIWAYYTTNLSRSTFQWRHRASDQILISLIKAGSMEYYENVHSQSGLLTIASVFSLFLGNLQIGSFPFAESTICVLVESTKYWESFKDSQSAVQLLKVSVRLRYDKAVAQLLGRGVGVHRRDQGVSALEHVYRLPAKDDKDVARVRQFLQHADPELLNQRNPTLGLGLIHIFNSQDEQQFRQKILELTVQSGASPNLRIAFDVGSTGLIYHLDQKNFELASVLLEQGADPLIPSLCGWTAVHMAAARGAMSFLLRLLSANESTWTIDWEYGCRSVFRSETFDNATPLHLAATVSGDFLLSLLEKVPSINLEAATDTGFTAIHAAAMAGSINYIEALVSRGANINARSADGRLALHIVVEDGNLNLVDKLLELGSETTARSDGMTPLLLAYEKSYQSIIDRLNAHAVESPAAAPVCDTVPSSALAKAVSSAVRAGNLSACKGLLNLSSSIDFDISEDGTSGFTPLAFAIRHGMLEIAAWLLDEGSNANCHYGDGTSAIQDMIQDDSLNSILEAMLDKYLADGGSILSEPDSLIYSAVDVGNTEGLRLLLDHLRTNEKEYTERAGSKGLAAVRIAVNRRQGDSIPLHRAIQTTNTEAIQLLLDHGADLEARDSWQRTPLLYATQKLTDLDASCIVPMLVQAGSNVHCLDYGGMNSLMGACNNQSPDLILYLLGFGIDIHATDQMGRNSLHFLVHSMDETGSNSILPSMFLRLTQGHIDPYQPQDLGWSALHMSMHRRSMTTFLLNGEFQKLELPPMPWPPTIECTAFPDLACLTSGFRLYRRKMSFESFRRLLNTEPVGVWSPLCRAAAEGRTEVMKNLLLMGSQIDFEGCPEGSALMAASRAGILESVIFLIRNGAAMSFEGRKKHYSAVEASAKSTRVLR